MDVGTYYTICFSNKLAFEYLITFSNHRFGLRTGMLQQGYDESFGGGQHRNGFACSALFGAVDIIYSSEKGSNSSHASIHLTLLSLALDSRIDILVLNPFSCSGKTFSAYASFFVK